MSNCHPKIKKPGRKPYKMTEEQKRQRSEQVKTQWDMKKHRSECASEKLRDDLEAQ